MQYNQRSEKGDFFDMQNVPFRWFFFAIVKGDHVLKKVKKGEKGD